MIGIDAFSWGKLFRLEKYNEFSELIEYIISEIDFFITSEGKIEFEHFYPEYAHILDKTTILPVLQQESYYKYIKRFDNNDASLLECHELRNYWIITEDRPLLDEGVTNKMDSLGLIDFFGDLFMRKELTRSQILQLIKILS